VAVVTKTYKDSELRLFLEKDERLRIELGFCRVPHRTTIGERLSSLIEEASGTNQLSWQGDSKRS
jgi:hypothetical protein